MRESLIARGDAWVLGWSPPVLFALFHRQPSTQDFDHFLDAQFEDIDAWPTWVQRCVIHHATTSGTISATQRQRAADLVSSRRQKLSAICLGYAFCTQSGATRGLSKVIHWLAPPPYPFFQAHTVTQGLKLLQAVDARIDPQALANRYKTLFAEFLSLEDGKEI